MPIVYVTAFRGRTFEQKKELAKRITDACCDVYKAKPDGVRVIYLEVGKDDIAVGGRFFSEMEEEASKVSR